MIFRPQDIPVIGQPFVILGHYETVLIQCTCEARTPMILVDTGNVATCRGCGSQYAITDQKGCSVGLVSRLVENVS